MTTLDRIAQVLLQRVAANARQFDGIADRDASMLTGKFDDPQRQVGQGGQHYSFAFDLLFKSPDLLGQRAQEENQPRLPVGCNRSD